MYELAIYLEEKSSTPLYEQIYGHIKEEIRGKTLASGTRLPSTRALAENLSVSRSTTQMAYDQLLAEGYIESVPCKGYFVAELEGVFALAKPKQMSGESGSLAETVKDAINCSPRGIDFSQFPYNTWRRLCKTTLIDDNKEMFAGGHPQGEQALREAIRDYLHAARGVNASVHNIIIGAGNGYLLTLLHQILQLARQDNLIAMENPTYKQAYRILTACGASIVPIEMDEKGMSLAELKKCGANIAYVMPSHQFPTGIAMPITRRMELLSWAGEEENRYIIEDDYDSEFRYKGKPIPALQGVDTSDKVIYFGTFSRAIAPGIRVGYMVLPPELLQVYRKNLGFYDCTVSRIDQNVLAEFIREGYFERHLNRMRGLYRKKNEVLLEALEPLKKDFEIRGEQAGLHVLLTSKNGIAETELVTRAKKAGVIVEPMSKSVIGELSDRYENTVLIGYAGLTEKEISEAVKKLKKVLQDT